MKFSITSPTRVLAEVSLPSSKSISNRVLILNALSGNTCVMKNIADCDDTAVMQNSLSHQVTDGEAVVTDVHGAGTSMRFLTAYYSLLKGTHVLTGSQRMLSRPINVLVDALRSLGAKIDYLGKEGFPPLRISGGLMKGGSVSLPADISSQYISALLMIAPKLEGGLKIELKGKIASLPYINMTLALMKKFGAVASWTSDKTIMVEEGNYALNEYRVESDWSAASYWYEMVMLSKSKDARVYLRGLQKDSLQGDSKAMEYFDGLGVKTHSYDNGIWLEKQPLTVKNKVVLDLHDEPDLAQTFVVSCVMAGLHFNFSGLSNLRIKETDRLAALVNEMRKFGYVLHADSKGHISWKGETCEPEESPVVKTYDDHRMAMSFAPASINMERIVIENPEVVSKSYPKYWENLQAVGFKIERESE